MRNKDMTRREENAIGLIASYRMGALFNENVEFEIENLEIDSFGDIMINGHCYIQGCTMYDFECEISLYSTRIRILKDDESYYYFRWIKDSLTREDIRETDYANGIDFLTYTYKHRIYEDGTHTYFTL